MKGTSEKQSLNMKQAARRLRMSYRHIKRLVRVGRIEAHRDGNEKKIAMKEIYRFMGLE